MILWIIQTTLISIVLIFLVHHLINFFKTTLTVPKIKDLVNTPTQKYEHMYNIINQHTQNKPIDVDNDYTLVDLLPNEPNTMKNELKNFLKTQMNDTSNDSLSLNY